MRLHITYAGGTIGMVSSPTGLTPGDSLGIWLRAQCEAAQLNDVTLTTLDPLIDSAHATPTSWQQIIDDIRRAHATHSPDAFLVLHGTDTLAYTSAALSYALTDIRQPIILTGSQLPAASPGSDAPANLSGALQAAHLQVEALTQPPSPTEHSMQEEPGAQDCTLSPRRSGVSVFFGQHLWPGAGVTKTSSWAFEGFSAPTRGPVATAGAPWQWHGSPCGTGWDSPVLPYREADIPVIDVAPGLSAHRLRSLLTPAPDGLILRAYGAGNIPALTPGFVDTLGDLTAAGVPVLVASQCTQADVRLGHYDSSAALREIGALSAGSLTLEAVYAKLHFLLAQGCSLPDIRSHMERSIAGE